MSTPFFVTVTGGRVDEKISLIKDVREVIDSSLLEAKEVVEGMLSVETGSEEDARYIARVLSAKGATSMVGSVADAPNPPRLRASIRRTVSNLGPDWAPGPSVTVPPSSTTVSPVSPSQVQDIEVARARGIASRFEARVHTAYVPPASAVSSILNDMNKHLGHVREEADAMRSVQKKIRNALIEKGFDDASTYERVADRRLPLDRWLSKVHHWTEVASSSPLPSDQSHLWHLDYECTQLLGHEWLQCINLEAVAAKRLESAFEKPFNTLRNSLAESWDGAITDNPRATGLDWWKSAWAGHRLSPEAGLHPTVSPAVVRLSAMKTAVSLAVPTPSWKVYEQATTLPGTAGSAPDHALPHFQVEIDLDRDGGFVTDDKTAIETATIDLLGQLPGGRVKVEVIDPLQLGDSARFLFDLNDAGDRILADAIWTTTEHIAKVVAQLEEHITFVTQKYLRGRNSLTEYNIDAGEIAEPYRLLVLYDYPAGFSRDGKHFDEEILTRLERIAAVGRRAGVYIFAHTPDGRSANRLSPLVQLNPQGLGLKAATDDAGDPPDRFQARIDSYMYPADLAYVRSEDGRAGLMKYYYLLQLLGIHRKAYSPRALVGKWVWVVETGRSISDFRYHTPGGLPLWEPVDVTSVPGTIPSASPAVAEFRFFWEMTTNAAPDADTRRDLFAGLLRALQNSETTKVNPSTIVKLSRDRCASDMQKGLAVESVVDVDDPATWWRSASTDRLQLSFGRLGASDVARVEFNSALNSSALIGGRTGSGKSHLIHALIMDAITRYSPEELTLYLCDLKEGVEFKQYADARLPHARAIAVESNREFAVSLLEALDKEITERGALFKAKAGGTAVNITQFRQETGLTWPRVMIIIDEFHKIFEQDDRLARRAMQLLERVIKEGRAFGVHTVLASQSLGNVDASFKSLAGQIPYRLVLASSDNDSRILLGEDNADAKLLTKAGEGILNAKGGARESNQRFQTTYWAPDHRQTILDSVTKLARQSGFDRHPHVFEGNAEVRADDYEPSLYRGDGQGITIPVGAPMSMGPPITTKFERAPGGNLLIVDVEGLGNLPVLITSLLAQGIDVTAVNFAAIEHEWEPIFDALVAEGLIQTNRRRIDEVVDLLVREVVERHGNSDYRAAPKVLTLIGVHRARELDPDDYDDDSLLAKVRRLVKDGPEVGVHVVAWADRKASLDRRFDSQTLREFGLRFLGRMSEDDSRSLADTEQAAAITPAQVVFDDFDKAVTVVARRLGFPGPEWIGAVMRGE